MKTEKSSVTRCSAGVGTAISAILVPPFGEEAEAVQAGAVFNQNLKIQIKELEEKLVSSHLAPELKPSQTPKENKFPTGHAFEIILPNLIHKSKKRNLQ